jgi:ribosomal protein L32
MLDSELKYLPPDKPILRPNVTCPYCGRDVTKDGEKEHVVGRRFVPRGTLYQQWNLILRACLRCNRRKSDLEDDISAITMQRDVRGRHAVDDPVLAQEAIRKGKKSYSRRTKKLVKDSRETITLKAELAPGFHITNNLTCGPQIDTPRLGELAHMQIRAFFYLVTYDVEKRAGRFWHGPFMLADRCTRLDWGNPTMRGFMDAVASWEPRILAVGAGGFFKIALRKHPTANCWSWALEWNQNLRAVGFCGDDATVRAETAALPKPQMLSLSEGPDSVRFRWDIPIADEADKLFYWPGFGTGAVNTGADRDER